MSRQCRPSRSFARPRTGRACRSRRTRKEKAPPRRGPFCAMLPALRSLVADLDDLIGLGAARRLDLDGIADGLADQRATERRIDGEQPAADIGLVLPDDLILHPLVGILVRQLDRRAELDLLAREAR